jgi:hypothetical protein
VIEGKGPARRVAEQTGQKTGNIPGKVKGGIPNIYLGIKRHAASPLMHHFKFHDFSRTFRKARAAEMQRPIMGEQGTDVITGCWRKGGARPYRFGPGAGLR